MRTIKFRVFDALPRPVIGMIDAPSFSVENGAPKIPDDYTLMQFTGQQDANKRDIYEADIVQLGPDKGIIEWDSYHNGWRLQYIGYNYRRPFFKPDAQICKIIGNIYEHPELMP